jgi:predicted RNA binding protein YcfA (HicA-like mRNA interferase family)
MRIGSSTFQESQFFVLHSPAILIEMKVREIIKLLEQDGWYRIPAKGGHRQFKHQTKLGRVTVSGKMSHQLPAGTVNSILKQADLK